MCKAKFGHTNWARMSAVTPFDLHNNPCDIDYENGIVFFHKAINVWKSLTDMYTQKVHAQILQGLGITRSTDKSKSSRQSPLFLDKHNQKKNKKAWIDGANESDCAKLKKLHEMLP